jgi:DNA-directed RNA polymerase specialized sigma24 family protein
MNSPDVAAALYAGAPDAAGQLYDAHAEALLHYCWLTLRNRQHAQTAVTEALVQAGARVSELSDPGTLRAWLFTLARAECHRHPLPSLGDTDEPIARPEQPDAALRIMAWNSVMSLDLVERQALDLNTRHGMTAPEISLILGLPLPGTTELLAAARETLEQALGAEILVSRDSQECPGRTEAIHGWTGTVTPAFRARLLKHAASCEVCQPRLPRNVSSSRIFGLLPAPALDGEVRGQVIAQVIERVRAQAAELELDPVPQPEPAQSESAQSEPAQAQSVMPDPVEPDPVVPDPAAPSPIVADPAVTPDARPDEPPVEHHESPVEIGSPGLAVRSADVPEPAVRERAVPAAAVAAAAPEPPAATSPQKVQRPQNKQNNQSSPRPQRPPRPPAPPRPASAQTHRSAPKPKKRRRGIRLFAGLGAALLALGIAAGLTYGSLGTSRAQLSGADSRYVPGGASSAPASGGPLPSPYAPSPTPRTHGPGKRSVPTSPAAGAGHADAVASDKAGTGNRTITTRGQGTHQTVTVAVRPSASASTHTQAAAQLTVTPADLDLGTGSSGSVMLSVSGGSMSWTASPSSGVSVDPSGGRLGNGDSQSITISVAGQRGSGGSGVVSIDGAQVSVSWSATATATATPSSPPSRGSSGSSGPSGGSGPSDASSPPARTQRHHRPDPGGGSPDPGAS